MFNAPNIFAKKEKDFEKRTKMSNFAENCKE